MMAMLDAAAASFLVVLTKIDKLKKSERDAAINDAERLAAEHTAAHPQVIATSAETGEGMPELRAHLAVLAETGYKAAASGKRA
jgi:GTP-binding protein